MGEIDPRQIRDSVERVRTMLRGGPSDGPIGLTTPNQIAEIDRELGRASELLEQLARRRVESQIAIRVVAAKLNGRDRGRLIRALEG